MTTPHERHDHSAREDVALNVLVGLVPRVSYTQQSPDSLREQSTFASGMLSTMPIILASSLAVSMTLAGSVSPANAQALLEPSTDAQGRNPSSTGAGAFEDSSRSSAIDVAPDSYTVTAGDTVSGIAGRFGLSTASVLALNGLGWKSLIFPGQSLRLTTAPVVAAQQETPIADSSNSASYTIVTGDTVSSIAAQFGVSIQSVLSANGLTWSTIIYPQQTILIPTVPPGTAPTTGSVTETDTGTNAPTEATGTSGVVDPAMTGTSSTVTASGISTSVTAGSPVSSKKSPAKTDTTTKPTTKPTPIPTPAPAPIPTPAPAPDQPAVSGLKYLIKSGDSLSAIAHTFGVSVAALRSANGMGTSSAIFVGRTLIIPGIAQPAGDSDSITVLSEDSQVQARTIISVGRALGVSDYGIIIALSAAMQESSMRNINYGHLDSVGLFQQRPSSGWGTVAQLTTPQYAARLFFGGPTNPNAGKTRGLLDISGWSSMTVSQAAQKVQKSAYPEAYAKWESSARYWLANL